MALEPGAVLDSRYRIVRAIKAGGMGAVYEALDTRLNDAPCALKEMHDFSESDTATFIRTKFEEEKRLLAALNHPGIPRVKDFFIKERTCYIIMDLVRGTNLEQELRDHTALTGTPYPPEKVAELAVQVLEILAYLHHHNPPLIHRDVKPANLIRDAEHGKIWLVDFGLAVSYTGVSRTEVGTLGYAPIEQIRGKAEPRSDLYSVGVTMHHLLTGKYPVPLSMPPVREIMPEADPALAAIIDRACADKPEDRFESADSMLDAVKQWLRGPAPPVVAAAGLVPGAMVRPGSGNPPLVDAPAPQPGVPTPPPAVAPPGGGLPPWVAPALAVLCVAVFPLGWYMGHGGGADTGVSPTASPSAVAVVSTAPEVSSTPLTAPPAPSQTPVAVYTPPPLPLHPHRLKPKPKPKPRPVSTADGVAVGPTAGLSQGKGALWWAQPGTGEYGSSHTVRALSGFTATIGDEWSLAGPLGTYMKGETAVITVRAKRGQPNRSESVDQSEQVPRNIHGFRARRKWRYQHRDVHLGDVGFTIPEAFVHWTYSPGGRAQMVASANRWIETLTHLRPGWTGQIKSIHAGERAVDIQFANEAGEPAYGQILFRSIPGKGIVIARLFSTTPGYWSFTDLRKIAATLTVP